MSSSTFDWQPMDGAPKDGTRVFAKDVDGNQRWTWFSDGEWTCASWRETEGQQAYEADDWWEPLFWVANWQGTE